MSHADNGRAPQRSASLVWGLLFIVVAVLTVLTSNHLVGHEAVRIGFPLALIAIGLLGLVVGNTGSRSRIKNVGVGAPGTPETAPGTYEPVRDTREHDTREQGEP
ncbi:MAG: hypothetical protein E7Z97_09535 [Propionibacteriaceae bacterium]|uniref:Uncharacterized protein n=1 Tax=Propionibacterium ruminifibrarum TaxID=1962131 RepID=A0A375I2W4_9ACTN|nr:hypothetical protein [Propionibacterium ruminifibrarum]MBE6478287.1 hypothetical protein [Propionibacteriaceae bacterium]SPF67736.1 hypothetical protein PROPJV5_0695 [Propionibacterium ruminifibrarum]